MKQETLIANGIHYLSGIGHATMKDEWDNSTIDVDIFCIDGVNYGAYINPYDGYRSYGEIGLFSNDGKVFMHRFPPQKVVVENRHRLVKDEYGYEIVDAYEMIISDAILNKEVLRVGTDYSDSYYPMAIFDYQPMNLYANVERSIYGYNA